jgi:uncharacterized protein (TIGR02145 family)
MADVLANAIRLTSSTTKLFFLGSDAPTGNGLTTVTVDGVEHDVIDDGNTNNGWVVVDGFITGSRVIVSADFPEPSPSEPALGYGLLYNWYAATDVRGVAPSGFRVATDSDFQTLRSELGGTTLAGGQLKSTRTAPEVEPRWEAPNTDATDSTGFSAFPSGRRFGGGYSVFGMFMQLHVADDTPNSIIWTLSNSSGSLSRDQFFNQKNDGFSLRCLSETEPSTTTVTDNDGNEYTWVQIGSQYWLAQNLKTTTYNNGDAIPTGLNNTEWANTTDGAWAYPNGDSSLPI